MDFLLLLFFLCRADRIQLLKNEPKNSLIIFWWKLSISKALNFGELNVPLQQPSSFPQGQAFVLKEDESNPANWLYRTLSSRNSAVVDFFAELFISQAKPHLHYGIVMCFPLISYFGFLRLSVIFLLANLHCPRIWEVGLNSFNWPMMWKMIVFYIENELK